MIPKARVLKELPSIGAERTLKVLAGRWKLMILWSLIARPSRLVEIEDSIPAASQKVLLDQLRELEAHGLVSRAVTKKPRPIIVYSATPLGRAMRSLILDLCAWGKRLGAAEKTSAVGAEGRDSLRGLTAARTRGRAANPRSLTRMVVRKAGPAQG